MISEKKRDKWVDYVKVVACILVVMGHFYQSMVKSGLLADSFFYKWFNTTIYFFHVQLFFICSGYLYQKYSVVHTIGEWKNNVLKKFIALGVPYFVFSLVTWFLKKKFALSVNEELGGLGHTLFCNPTSPYWYLYILFILFFITPTVVRKSQLICVMIISSTLILIRASGFASGIYLLDTLMIDWIWFVLGMALACGFVKLCNVRVGIVIFVFFLVGCVIVTYGYYANGYSTVTLGLIACYAVVSVIHAISEPERDNRLMDFCAKYTMPVFLMHTLVAAPFRSLLFKIGVQNSFIHILFGLLISFWGPIAAMMIMDRIKPLDFIVYPTRYLKFSKRS